jgi:acyl carrier protein
MDIKKTISTFILDYFLSGDESRTVADDDSFIDKGIIDSTGVLELVAFIEETFDIRIEDEELIPENLDSVNRLITYIQLKLKVK